LRMPNILPLFSAILVSGWLLFVWRLFASPRERRGRRFLGNLPQKGVTSLARYEREAAAAGWQVNSRELAGLVLLAVAAAAFAAALTHNPLIFAAGFVLSFYLPRSLIEKKRRSSRLHLVSALAGSFRLLLSRLPEQQNITRALEKTRDEIHDESIRTLFDGYLQDLALCGSVRESLLKMKEKVNVKKCDLFFESLILAHYEGFTLQACRALDKAVEALEFDLRAIGKVAEQNRFKKRKLYLTVAVVWFFPVILSFVNTSDKNIYLHTWPGKLLLFFYFAGAIHVYVKGEEYLNLRMDEL